MTHAHFPAVDHQDWILGRRLPAWLTAASPERIRALQDAMSLSLYFQQSAKALLDGLQAPDVFAAPLLDAALRRILEDPLDLATLRFRTGTREIVITSQPIGYPVTQAVYRDIPILEAAMRNFTAEQAEPGGQLVGNGLLSLAVPEARLPSAAQFAQLCRQLDLGGQYQRHLQQVLLPADSGSEPTGDGGRQRLSVLARAHRYGMLADAHVAHLKGHLNESELQLVVQVCALNPKPSLEGRSVQVKGLELLGCRLERILVLDVRDESLSPVYTSSHRVLVHIPGDPHTPWRAFANLRYFANDLGRRLRTAPYQRFFSRFVRRRYAFSFFEQVTSGYEGVSDLANIALEEHMYALPEPVFDHLAMARIEQIMDDAAMIAVPVSAVDEQVQREHDQRLASEGWALLNLAGLFVPAIGLGLLAVSALELLQEGYHGFQAWREGDTSEALDHLLNVAGDMATFAAMTAGITVAQRLWSRSSWVDELLPATLEDGTTRLWREDVQAYRSAPPADAQCDEQGIWRQADRAWVRIDSHHYAVQQNADLRWQLVPRNGYGPLLDHNGAGAWRFWWEQPLQWEDPYQLCRRLGEGWAQLDDGQLDEIIHIHGLDAGQLRAVHVDGRAPDAAWLDTVERYQLDRRLRLTIDQLRSGRPAEDVQVLAQARSLPGASQASDQTLAELAWGQRRVLFERLYQAVQVDQAPALQALRRQYPSLHSRGAEQVLALAKVTDRARLLQSGRVPLSIAESALATARRIRVARVLEGFYLDASQSADLARVSIHLLGRMPGATGTGWRLYEGSLSGPVLSTVEAEEGAATFDLVHRDGHFRMIGAELDVSGWLFDVLAQTFDLAQCQSMDLSEPLAHNLRVCLTRFASLRRDEIERALGLSRTTGLFRAPLRSSNGRIGYPLSGRGNRRSRALYARVRALYPSFSDAEVESWLLATRAQGVDHNLELQRLSAELDSLREHLNLWTQQAQGLMERSERGSLRDALMAAWRRQSQRVANNVGEPIGYRLALWSVPMRRLPELPDHVRFGHVRSLSMSCMSLEEIPESFVVAFSGVQSLALTNNELTRLPPAVERLAQLRELDLYGNSIVLDEADVTRLAACRQLRRLNLSFNPLGRSLSVSAMTRLESLQMRGTGVDALPEGLLDLQLLQDVDLRNNHITQVPDAYYRVPLWVSGAILLGENPLEEASARRLRSFMRRNGWLEDAQGEEEPGDMSADDPVHALNQAREGWLGSISPGQAREFGEAWEALMAEPGSLDYLRLLGRLRETRDYRTDPTGLGARVSAMLAAARDHGELRQELFDLSRGLEGCDDAVIGRFSDLEVHLLVWQARCAAERGGERAALLYLGRQLWRLDEVDRIIAEALQRRRLDGGRPDEVEVGLAYRLGLRDEFDLPAQPATMSYREVAGVSAADLNAARARLREAETDAAVAQSMVWKSFWRTHVVAADPTGFEQLDQRFHSRLQVVGDMIEGKTYDQVLEARATHAQALQSQSETLAIQLQDAGQDAEAAQRYQAALAVNARELEEARAELALMQADSDFAERVRHLQSTTDDYQGWLTSIGRDREAARDARVLEYTLAAFADSRPEPQPGPSNAPS